MSLQVSDLSFSYPHHSVLQKLSISGLQAGELTVLIGPNAAGKSTLFRCLSGLLHPDSGEMLLHQIELSTLSTAKRFEQVCYMPQVYASNAMLTVFDVVLLARKHVGSMSSWKVDDEDLQAVEHLLARVGIEHLSQEYVKELSGGQQQMVSICQAMARSPRLFLFDEPTSALDLNHQHRMMHLFREETQKRNVITILILHDLALAARYADRILVMDEGEIPLMGTTSEVFASPELSRIYQMQIETFTDSRGALVVSASHRA